MGKQCYYFCSNWKANKFKQHIINGWNISLGKKCKHRCIKKIGNIPPRAMGDNLKLVKSNKTNNFKKEKKNLRNVVFQPENNGCISWGNKSKATYKNSQSVHMSDKLDGSTKLEFNEKFA